jgi:curli biogenesis system outer membrane secretion channel CsgG
MNSRSTVILTLLCLVLFSCTSTGSPPASAQKQYPADGAIAVWEIENLSILGNTQPDITDFLTSRVLETIRAEGNMVVEREKLLSVLTELSLGAGDLADSETQLRIGRLAGAKRMVFGGYQVMGQTMRIDLRMVEVETGRILSAREKTVESGGMAAWLTAAEEAARSLVRDE